MTLIINAAMSYAQSYLCSPELLYSPKGRALIFKVSCSVSVFALETASSFHKEEASAQHAAAFLPRWPFNMLHGSEHLVTFTSVCVWNYWANYH